MSSSSKNKSRSSRSSKSNRSHKSSRSKSISSDDSELAPFIRFGNTTKKILLRKLKPIIEYLERKENRGWVAVLGSVSLGIFILSLLWKYIFTFMTFNVLCKIYLWFLEHYDNNNNNDSDYNESIEVNGEDDKRLYMITNNPVNVVEYVIIMITMGLLTPLGHLPYVGMFVNLLLILASVITATNAKYRKKLCMSIKNVLVSKSYQKNQRKRGYTCSSRNVGRVHETLRNICGCFDAINIGAYNIVCNFKHCYDEMNGSETIKDGMYLVFHELNPNKSNTSSDNDYDNVDSSNANDSDTDSNDSHSDNSNDSDDNHSHANSCDCE